MALTSGFHLEPRFADTDHRVRLMTAHVPAMIMGLARSDTVWSEAN